ncbi:MAG: SGNH/GDSL hydrolase family protein [Planctomycetia bacterium]|nr:SGNH/GDSL hydrolase family protein [Planctomycetia bacterium]
MTRILSLLVLVIGATSMPAQDPQSLAGRRVVFLGDSITQAGGYIGYLTHHLETNYPKLDFDFLGLGLASETLSGLSEDGHAGGKFPRPCLFERLDRVLEKAKPEVVVACYGMNDGIYLPLGKERFGKFQSGVEKLIKQSQAAGVKRIVLVTPPIYDFAAKPGEFNYDSVLAEYAKWERSLKVPGVEVIDLHTPMRAARDARKEPFSKDKVHPGDDGQFFIAGVILKAFGESLPADSLKAVREAPIFKLVEEKRRLRSAAWMKHIGYTREATFPPQPLGSAENDAAKIQARIDALRRAK